MLFTTFIGAIAGILSTNKPLVNLLSQSGCIGYPGCRFLDNENNGNTLLPLPVHSAEIEPEVRVRGVDRRA